MLENMSALLVVPGVKWHCNNFKAFKNYLIIFLFKRSLLKSRYIILY